MKTDIWMPVIIGDYLKDTRKLNTVEHGAYFLIMMEMWVSGGHVEMRHLPNVSLLSKAKFKKVWINLEKYFEKSGNNISQKRLLIELHKSEGNREIKQKNGKLGGRPVTKKEPKNNLLVNLEKTSSPSPSPSSKSIPAKGRKRDPIWDIVCDLWGLKPQTPTEKSGLGKIVREMKTKGGTPELIKDLKEVYEREWPTMNCTPRAVLSHWDTFIKLLSPRSSPETGNQANMMLMNTRKIPIQGRNK